MSGLNRPTNETEKKSPWADDPACIEIKFPGADKSAVYGPEIGEIDGEN